MTNIPPPNHLPAAAIRDFEKARESGWGGGVSLGVLLDRVNRVADSFLPEHDGPGKGAGRVKRAFTERSFRHYQTLGLIDVPEKERRRALYGPRHFVQALLVRRLLWERVTADRIVGLIARRSIKETEGMFLYGVEYVARTEGGGEAKAQPTRYQQMLRACAESSVSAWTRVVLGEGIEIHLSDKRPKMTPEQRRQMTKRIEELVKEL
jgi:hypothetical protein